MYISYYVIIKGIEKNFKKICKNEKEAKELVHYWSSAGCDAKIGKELRIL